MSSRLLHPDEYELETRSSNDSQESFDLDEADFESQILPRARRRLRRVPLLSRLLTSTYSGYRRLKPSRPLISVTARPSCFPRFLFRRFCFYLHALGGIILALVLLTAVFRPSYTRFPPHYVSLRNAISQSNQPARGNPRNEKVFIAASLYDRGGKLAQGQWGFGLLHLIDLIGENNVFLSIYENNSGPEGKSALLGLEEQIKCNKSIIIEDQFDLDSLPRVTIPGGSKRTKRIDYLAEVRNRALRPLDQSETRYDRLLFLNDVMFDPIDVVQLLFSTNADEGGIAQYRAACAVDFSNPFKFYDTYATRDSQGYGMGLPFFPWFSNAGEGQSRKDVLAGKDAVRVRSCWGGMVAFDARFFQGSTQPTPEMGRDQFPARFRSAPDLFWEASECCLIHADIQNPPSNADDVMDTGIYMNPYVRVAYDTRTLSWLSTTRRFEKLYSFIHNLVNHLVGLPWFNPRRAEVRGQTVQETVWVPNEKHTNGGSFRTVTRTAGNDGYCGRRGLQPLDFGSRVTGIIHGVVGSFLERNFYTLEESSHAPRLKSSSESNLSQKESIKMSHPVADVNDTAGFMAAARALKLDPNKYRSASSAAENVPSEAGSVSMPHDGFENTSGDGDFIPIPSPARSGIPCNHFRKDNPTPPRVGDLAIASESASQAGGAVSPSALVEDEQREFATTFKTWGIPEVRDKPAARVRRIVLKGLPATWCNPSKVLSLVHGGVIESVTVNPSGTAHVLFCEHEACKAFYDRYPNGIDLNRERRVTVFVEMGKEVDVVSSQLSFCLSTGATRVVRTVGVNIDVTMRQLSDLATGNHRKVEKIVDTYVPGEARNVSFRFCSIDDAVRFRAMIVRNDSWEQCNTQYAADPCELATGIHSN
ncbi:cryptococcal mannosyltransferase 1-domain-containing protein [Aspergillus avenaceus]|uniref:Cryptococcal mannosyltransferase 1-domain-containing protein n=1 Tax=Aspergillus avenaceus TaxID=36643 RepID=A0A5N6TLJ0_ASPAV|nr:cryptococcal mannosyltransferase 1-domain-containing protein [Aspergillus avenaceus]